MMIISTLLTLSAMADSWQNYVDFIHTWSWLTIDPGLAWAEWLLVDEADDNTKELSELSELGLGAEASTALADILFLGTLELVQYGLVVDIIALLTVTCWPLTGSAVTKTSSSSSSSSSWNECPFSFKLFVLITLAFKVVVDPWLEDPLGGCHCHHCDMLSPWKKKNYPWNYLGIS